ncbi:hypothetical protein B0T10DRAFT_214735 [Thelonectria olida]|uniref:Uncharacterized protein n=1 Tax=Thelonectria olida TaxID=1576542 RepID=A0A9P9AQQ6_9HYPO|nr:hypothetical protein B0T10DRAFT_214735 [Thelonectria olida]
MPRRARAETLTAPGLTERPSTSGGLTRGQEANSLEKPDFNKRMSRDDLALTLKGSNLKAYHVPIRGRLPSPEYSPRADSPNRVAMVRTATPESIETGETGVIAIGMALGSPSQPPAQDNNAPAASRTRRAMTAAANFPEPREEDQTGQQKTRKWGIFRSKSKRNRPSDQTSTQRSLTDNSNASSTSVATRGHRSNSYTRNQQAQQDATKKTPKHKPIVVRSQTDPTTPGRADFKDVAAEKMSPKETKSAKDTKSGGLGRKVSLRGLRGDRARKAVEKEESFLHPPSPPPPVPQLSGPMLQLSGPLLDVEIPSIKMERYSVMFGGVLGPQNNSSSSSLLARRQATLDRLKTLNDEIAEGGEEELPRPRRATSPQPKASPAFSLFPGAPRASPSQPSPRLRSLTSPAMLRSPVRNTFGGESKSGKDQVKSETLQPRSFEPSRSTPGTNSPKLVSKFSKQPKRPSAPKSEGSRSRGLKSESSTALPEDSQGRRSRDPSPASLDVDAPLRRRQPSPFTPDTSSLVLDSEDEDDEVEVEVHIMEKLRPTFTEPTWQMVSPPVSTTSSSLSPRKTRKPSPTQRPSPPTSLKSEEQISVVKPKQEPVAAAVAAAFDPDEALRTAVEISIARQISVSHQQRQMLHPLKSNPSVRRRGKDGTGPNYGIPVGKNERLVETRTATPRLVRPEDINAWEMHRKSSRVILEGEPEKA